MRNVTKQTPVAYPKTRTAKGLAMFAVRLLAKGQAHNCRAYDTCFECGNGDEVVAEMCKMAVISTEFRSVCLQNGDIVPPVVMATARAMSDHVWKTVAKPQGGAA